MKTRFLDFLGALSLKTRVKRRSKILNQKVKVEKEKEN